MPDGSGQSSGSVAEAICALVTIVLAILALAHVVPDFLVAVATIVFRAALLLHGGALLAEYGRIYVQAGASASSVMPPDDRGLSAVLLAGAAGVVLGVLALPRINTTELTAIAVIAFGGALILGSGSALRVHILKLAPGRADERIQRLASEAFGSVSAVSGINLTSIMMAAYRRF